MTRTIAIFPARFPDHLHIVQAVFAAYERSQASDVCFKNFTRELATLPGEYAEPAGCILLAASAGTPAGCVALRRLSPEMGEMKRLFVFGASRRLGLGRGLAVRCVEIARERGYTRVVLETLPTMVAARRLYESLGFQVIPPYASAPVAGAVAMQAVLSPRTTASFDI